MQDKLGPDGQALIDGTLWAQFCKLLEQAGQVVLRESAPSDPQTRAEGFRYLSRMTRAGLEAFVEFADPQAPVLRRTVDETKKMGSDNPDNYYLNAAISGAYEYRITGSRGTVDYLAFATQKGGYGEGRGLPPTGQIEASQLELGPDGELELWVSCTPKPGNWLAMEPDSGMLIVRQTFGDRSREVPADLTIECIGREGPPHQPGPDAIGHGLRRTGMLVGGAAALFANWAEGFRKHPNELPQFNPQVSLMAGGDPAIAYYHAYWQLADDEALVIEFEPPVCHTWNFQVNNWWMESLDYRFHPVVINKFGAQVRDDGSVRLILSRRDPGLGNWLSTCGLPQGTMCLRWVRAESHPQPRARVVALADLDAERGIGETSPG